MSTDTKESKQIDIFEHGMERDGTQTSTDRRLFVQLQVFSGANDADALVAPIRDAGVEGVVYLDVLHPRGVGLLTLSEDPAHFVTQVRPLVNDGPWAALELRPELTMLGRTYASGYEPNLEDWLLQKPRRNVGNPDWPWAVWYPLRRQGGFNALPEAEQKSILREHGGIGRLYGEQDLAHDVRLACHGLDTNDNEFVIGLIGKNLHPLSHLVQTMRRTRQTSEFMQQMGPFFLGHAYWQSASLRSE